MSQTVNPDAREMGRGQEQSQGSHKDLGTETAIVELSSGLAPPGMYKVQERYRGNHKDPPAGPESTSGAALRETAIVTGLSGSFGEPRR